VLTDARILVTFYVYAVDVDVVIVVVVVAVNQRQLNLHFARNLTLEANQSQS